MALESNNFEDFKTSGIVLSNNFNEWRLKINGIINRVDNNYTKTESNARYLVLSSADEADVQDVTTRNHFQGEAFFDEGVIGPDGLFFNPTNTSPVGTTAGDVRIKPFDEGGGVVGLTVGDEAGIDANISLRVHTLKATKLENTGTTIDLRGITYTLPSATVEDGLLTIGAGDELSWTSRQAFIDAVAAEGSTFLTTDVVSPVGTVVRWYGDSGAVPSGWLEANGQTVQNDSAGTYDDLGVVFGEASNGDITLPNIDDGSAADYIYIVKTFENDVSQFNITANAGVKLFDDNNNVTSSINLTNQSGKIGLNLHSSLTTNASSQLTIASSGVTTSMVANLAITPAKLSTGGPSWNSSGEVTLQGEPTQDSHATTKAYVDTAISNNKGIASGGAITGSESNGDSFPMTRAPLASIWIDDGGNGYACSDWNSNNVFGFYDAEAGSRIPAPLESEPFTGLDEWYYNENQMFVIDRDAKLYCRGQNSWGAGGMLTNRSTSNQSQWFRSMSSVYSFKQVAVHPSDVDSISNVALTTDGKMFAAGNNRVGQLGIGTSGDGASTNTNVPSLITTDNTLASLPVIEKIYKTGGHAPNIAVRDSYIALDENGELWGWGGNTADELGLAGARTVTRPTKIEFPSSVTAIQEVYPGGNIRFNEMYCMAKDQDGNIWGWGTCVYDPFGRGSTTTLTTPTLIWDASVNGQVDKIKTTSGSYQSNMFLVDGDVYIAGYNYNGQMGLGSATSNTTLGAFVQIPSSAWTSDGFDKITDVYCMSGNDEPQVNYFLIAANNAETSFGLYFFGSNDNGEAGIGNVGIMRDPIRIPFPAENIDKIWGQISGNTIIHKSDGTLWYSGARRGITGRADAGHTLAFSPFPYTQTF